MLSTLFGDGHPVTAVGDPNQAIYGWRGASVGNLLRFGSHFPRSDGEAGIPQPPMTNFRCGRPPHPVIPAFGGGGRILDAANAGATRIGAGASVAPRPPLQVPPLAPRADAA